MNCFLLLAQIFAAQMPANVPDAPGTVVERAVLRSIDVRTGEGDPARPGQEYKVHYTGWLRDWSKFDSPEDRSQPFAFIQGRRRVIAGWENGFEGMRVGGRRRLFIPYQLAYGGAGRGSIPPKAELVFDVELFAVRDVPPEDPARDVLLVLARAIPEAKYSWRPSEGVRERWRSGGACGLRKSPHGRSRRRDAR